MEGDTSRFTPSDDGLDVEGKGSIEVEVIGEAEKFPDTGLKMVIVESQAGTSGLNTPRYLKQAGTVRGGPTARRASPGVAVSSQDAASSHEGSGTTTPDEIQIHAPIGSPACLDPITVSERLSQVKSQLVPTSHPSGVKK